MRVKDIIIFELILSTGPHHHRPHSNNWLHHDLYIINVMLILKVEADPDLGSDRKPGGPRHHPGQNRHFHFRRCPQYHPGKRHYHCHCWPRHQPGQQCHQHHFCCLSSFHQLSMAWTQRCVPDADTASMKNLYSK